MTLGRILIYTSRIDDMAAFYTRHFGYTRQQDTGDRIVELVPSDAGAAVMLHPLAKGRKSGQKLVKLVFDVIDVDEMVTRCAREGLAFGPIHQARGYRFANAADPDGNPIQVSSRSTRAQQSKCGPASKP